MEEDTQGKGGNLLLDEKYFDRKVKPFCYICKSDQHFLCPFPANPEKLEDYDSDIVEVSDFDDGLKFNSKEEEKIYEQNSDEFYAILDFFLNEKKKEEKSILMKSKNRNVFEFISNNDIQHTDFCYKCGGMHKANNCQEKKRNHPFSLLYKAEINTNFHVKNPLKYQAMAPRNEFVINHHQPINNYYDDENSSGETFADVVREHKKKYNKA